MKLLLEKQIKEPIKLECGDVIVHNSDSYIVMSFVHSYGTDKTYIAKSFNGKDGLCGLYTSLAGLNEAFIKRGLDKSTTVYKSNDYSLTLIKN